MYDYIIIGAGIIGLNMAKELKLKYKNAKILLIEKEKTVAFHSSGRNSGVLHAGFYYTSNSLKAKFTKEGNALLTQYCKDKNLKINNCGKIIVAKNEEELKGLKELKKRANINNVSLEYISKDELLAKYPKVKTYKKALYSPTTSSVDPIEVCNSIKNDIINLGVIIKFECKYLKRLQENEIYTSKGKFKAKKIINCAGLYADKIAKEFGLCKNFVIIPFKGIYLKDKNNYSNLNTNIYPVPNLNNPFLGVHYTLTVYNEAKIGPTAIPAFYRENYKGFDNFNLKELFSILYYEAKLFLFDAFSFRSLAYNEIKKYNKNYLKKLASSLVQNIELKDYDSWSKPGIRAQLLNSKTLELVQDFEVQSNKNSIHILNAISPAFTASIPFVKWIIKKYNI